jgi:glyoxylase-like metal-dependent hydrolase (beta-lactamase superfamily II)
MHPAPHPTIINVGYRSTNFWVISAGSSRLLVDLGWPGTIGAMRATLDRAGVPLRDIRYGFATHFHLDHAGAAQDLKLAGVPLLVADVQVPYIAHISDHVKPADHFTPITLHDNRVTTIDASRAVLAEVGIPGQLVHTPGHSPDSVSLLLTHPSFVTESEAAETLDSWRRLQRLGATTVYAGHGPVRPFPGDLI